MNLKFFIYVSFLLVFFTHFKETMALTVQDVSISDQGGIPTLSFVFDEAFSPEPDQEDEETLLIEFPEDTHWNPAISKSSNLGLSYTYIPYQDGAGDLLIKKDKRLSLGDLAQKSHNHYTLSFYGTSVPQHPREPSYSSQENREPSVLPNTASLPSQPIATPNEPLIIKGIRVGFKNHKTRLVFELNRRTKFIIKENDSFSSIYILPTEITQWLPTPTSSEAFGFFKGYQLIKLENDVGIEVSVVQGTRIVQASVIGEKTPNPKLVIDLAPKSFIPTIDQYAHPSKLDNAYTEMKEQNNLLLNKEKSLPSPPENTLIKEMNILSQNNDTIIRLLMSEVKNFDVQENKATNQVIIHLPKMDWSGVKVTEEKAGLVEGFKIDQTDPNFTNLVFEVDKTTSVIGKKSFGIRNNARFVVYLNQKEKKTPTWLIDASASELSYDNLEKEEGETSRLVYRGGITPYTNIGDGFYMGLKAASLGGQEESHSSHGGFSNSLSSANFGTGLHLLGGYGFALDKIYTGGEINLGIYKADNKNSYDILGGVQSTSSSEITTTWGVTGRLGYYVSPTSLLYARLGVNSSKFTYSGTSTATGQIIFPGNYAQGNRTGFLYGLGLESALNDRLSIRVEGAQINYQPFHYQSGSDYKKDRPLLNEINMGIGYKIDPMTGPAVGDVFEESVGTGFYFGADGGLSTLINRRHVMGTSNTGGPTLYDGTGSDADPAWGIFGGYSYLHDKSFMAGEFQLALTKPLISESIAQGGTTTESYSNRLQWLWALTGRLGYVFNHGTIGYGRFGLVGGGLSHTGQHSGVQNAFTVDGSSKSYGLGIRIGAGIETFLTRHLSLRSDYILDYMPGFKIKNPNNASLTEKISILNNEFKLGLSWYVNP